MLSCIAAPRALGLRTTFDELGRRAHLRTDDVALALQDTPLVRLARDGAHARDEILLTREALDEVRLPALPPLAGRSKGFVCT